MPAARQRPGTKAKQKEEPAQPAAKRVNPRQAKSIGNQDTQSRPKADVAAKRAESQQEEAQGDAWPRTPDGRPMVQIKMASAELIPTGQYANVSVGPCQITTFIDPDSPAPFTEAQRENMAAALNQLAEIVESDVVSVQRNLVLESIQEQIASGG